MDVRMYVLYERKLHFALVRHARIKKSVCPRDFATINAVIFIAISRPDYSTSASITDSLFLSIDRGWALPFTTLRSVRGLSHIIALLSHRIGL